MFSRRFGFSILFVMIIGLSLLGAGPKAQVQALRPSGTSPLAPTKPLYILSAA